MELFGWRAVISGSGTITLLLSLAIWIFVRDDPAQKGYVSYADGITASNHGSKASIRTDLSNLFRYKNAWILSIVPASLVGPLLTFTGLWGIPYLTTHYHLSPVKSAGLISILLIACAIGGPVLGALSEKTGLRKPIYFWALCISSIGWIPILFLQYNPMWLIVVLFSIVGFAASAMIIGMAFIKESVPAALTGTVSGVCNMGMEMGPLALQPAMGWILDAMWDGVSENGIRIYDLNAYHLAFSAMVGVSILGALLINFTRETYCQQLN
jgi:sugar phosphate permease